MGVDRPLSGRPVALLTRRAGSANDLRYFLYDHLGSIDAILDDAGGVEMRQSFDAFGGRRDPDDWVGSPQSLPGDITDQGFTAHHNLEGSTLIHMRGRVMDSLTGRFLSADPYVPGPGDTQRSW